MNIAASLSEKEKVFLQNLIKGRTMEDISADIGRYPADTLRSNLFALYDVETKEQLVIAYLKDLNPNLTLWMDPEVDLVRFSKQQILVLNELVAGKTFREISQETGVAYFNVVSKIRAVKQKIPYMNKCTVIYVLIFWLRGLNPNMRTY